MPYTLEQSGTGYYVVGPSGRHSRRPLPKARAEAQLRALYASEKASATSPTVIPPNGPGGLFNTPGLGTGRKWGKKRKESRYTFQFKATGAPGEKIAPGVTRIRGNLCNVHGKYGPCDKADLSGKPVDTTKRDQNRANTDKQLGLFEDATAALNDLADGKVVTDDGGLVKLGLAEQNPDGSFRLTGAGKQLNTARNSGNLGNARNAMGDGQALAAKREAQAGKRQAADQKKRETEAKRTSDRAQREAERKRRQAESDARREQARADAEKRRQEQDAQRQERANQPRPEKPVPAPRQPLADRVQQRAREQAEQKKANRAAVRTQMMQGDVGLSPAGFDAFTAFADGGQLTPQMAQGFSDMGLVEGTPPRLTKVGQQVVKNIDAGNFRAAADGIGRATDDVAERRAAEQPTPKIPPSKRPRQRPDIPAPRAKSFVVFKEASGRLRWISRTTTAFKDRDDEILSVAALERAVARMKATRLYGPLRWWHLGKPTPEDPNRPWGPGFDLGMCDTSMVIGRTLVESGTFFDDAIGAALAEKASDQEMSPGFYYADHWRQPDGTFDDMAIFERSPVPTRYGRASNYFTGFAVKEYRMNEQEIARKLAAFKAETGADDATIARLSQALTTAEKSADQQRVAFKEAPLVYQAPDGTQGIIQDGRFVALKAPMPPTEMIEAGTTELEDGAAELGNPPPVASGEQVAVEDEFVGDMSVSAFKTMIQAIIQELSGPIVELDSKMAAMGYERKTKEQDAQIAQLRALVTEANVKIKELQGTGKPYRPSQDETPAEVQAAIKAREEAQEPVPVPEGMSEQDAKVFRWAAKGLAPLPWINVPGLNGASAE